MYEINAAYLITAAAAKGFAQKPPPSMHKVMEELDEIELCFNKVDAFPRPWVMCARFGAIYEAIFINTLNNFTKEEKEHIDELLIKSLENGHVFILNPVAHRILDKRDLIDWKKRSDIVNRVVDAIIVSGTQEQAENQMRNYTDFMAKFLDLLIANQILEQHCAKIIEIIREAFRMVQDPNRPIHTAATPCVMKYPWKDQPGNIPEVVTLILAAVKSNPDIPKGCRLHTNARMAFSAMFASHSGKSIHVSVLNEVTEMFNFCLKQDWQWSQDLSKTNLAYEMLRLILEDFLNKGNTSPDVVKPMMRGIKELWRSSDNLLQQDADCIIKAMAGHSDLTGDATEVLLEKYLKSKDPQISAKLKNIYEEQPAKVHPFLPRFVDWLKSDDDPMQIPVIQMFTQVAKGAPKEISPAAIKVITGKLSSSTDCYAAMTFLDATATQRRADVVPHEDEIIKAYNSSEMMIGLAGGVLLKLADAESRQLKYLYAFAARTSTVSEDTQGSIIAQMRQLGMNCPQILAEHRALVERLRSKPALTEVCQATLDVIDGRSLEKVSYEVIGQRKDINQLDTRVTSTEGDVVVIKKDVRENQQDMATVRTDVNDQGQKLSELEVVVAETVVKVDELERKTLSHAPAWSRDVARLLNPDSDHDWRLLASRLGYTWEDVRSWATQPDPCLSLLDEWFATHKTREATHAVLKTLKEINRTDAAAVIERSLKSVERVILNDESDPPTPPPIFLSYQWGHQKEIKLLRRHLGLSGYASWLDVGQMGGGDKLFAKIDAGIRAAKVIVCCVTSKYAESPNCNREVNLAVTLGKPIIPLLVEKMNWPPPGAMGPIFGEYIFIRFFQRDGEQTRDERYWPQDKFTELLLQLRYHIAPEVAAIPEDSIYNNWWQPPKEVIAVKPKTNISHELTPVEVSNTLSSQIQMPEIYISYQWDKQIQIRALYRRLTAAGYNCWLDILQMGGGDSLFDKIDQGLRGCRVVLSCVTTKYSKSANCRREVSLADALKKPIIPLLLEQITWPPEGPMGPILTQHLYVNFAHHNASVQNSWNSAQFEELLVKLAGYVVK